MFSLVKHFSLMTTVLYSTPSRTRGDEPQIQESSLLLDSTFLLLLEADSRTESGTDEDDTGLLLLEGGFSLEAGMTDEEERSTEEEETTLLLLEGCVTEELEDFVSLLELDFTFLLLLLLTEEEETTFLLLLETSTGSMFLELLEESFSGSSNPIKLFAPGSRGLSRSPMS